MALPRMVREKSHFHSPLVPFRDEIFLCGEVRAFMKTMNDLEAIRSDLPTPYEGEGQVRRATLLLADGTAFHGRGLGFPTVASGELVFTTSMTGYQEALTDPSYRGQLLMFTYPLIGNYGT